MRDERFQYRAEAHSSPLDYIQSVLLEKIGISTKTSQLCTHLLSVYIFANLINSLFLQLLLTNPYNEISLSFSNLMKNEFNSYTLEGFKPLSLHFNLIFCRFASHLPDFISKGLSERKWITTKFRLILITACFPLQPRYLLGAKHLVVELKVSSVPTKRFHTF